MSNIDITDTSALAQVLEILKTERAKALSLREWKHRLAGYGFAIKHTDGGDVVTALPHGREICALPAGI